MRVVVIGAGSHSFGRGVIADLLGPAARCLPEPEIVLVDTAADALATMTALAERLKAQVGSAATVWATTDRRQALPGAEVVITAVSIARMALWEQDFRVPQAHGVAHILGENGGPGALFHALRSFELVLPICRDIEELCPSALLLNFTNPEARVLHAIGHLTNVRALGLCHGVYSLESLLCSLSGVPPEHLELTSAGLNHLYCALGVKDRRSGEELLPDLLRRVQEDDELAVPPLFREFARCFDVLTFPSDDHLGEYYAYGTEYHDHKWSYGRESQLVEAALPAPSEVDRFLAGKLSPDDLLRPSGEAAVPVICALQQEQPQRFPAVNVLNTQRLISNLPGGAAVEVPATVDRRGVQPQPVGALPEPFAATLRTQCEIIALVTEAYRTRSRRHLLQALLLDPCVHSIAAARAILDDMLRLQAAYLPRFT